MTAKKPSCRRCGWSRCRCGRRPGHRIPVEPKGDVVSYLRVSTTEQGISGLGLEAQRASIGAWCQATGSTLAKEFVEIFSGKRHDRPELKKAIALAARIKAKLVLAKIDRLGRNMAFISALMDTGCEFVALDCPSANRLTLHIMAAMAEAEGRAISSRTMAALQALKSRGVKLGAHREGSQKLTPEQIESGRRVARQNAQHRADRRFAEIRDDLLSWRQQGLAWSQCADLLNESGRYASRGRKWSKGNLHATWRRYCRQQAEIANSMQPVSL